LYRQNMAKIQKIQEECYIFAYVWTA
jgi:hypothetical protein